MRSREACCAEGDAESEPLAEWGREVRKQFTDEAEAGRYKGVPWATNRGDDHGLFHFKRNATELKVIVSSSDGWDHVSVSTPSRCPNWNEMQWIKTLFFDEEETVIQFHPKASEYVNNHPYCLHLWRRWDQEHELPPTWMVGILGGERD